MWKNEKVTITIISNPSVKKAMGQEIAENQSLLEGRARYKIGNKVGIFHSNRINDEMKRLVKQSKCIVAYFMKVDISGGVHYEKNNC